MKKKELLSRIKVLNKKVDEFGEAIEVLNERVETLNKRITVFRNLYMVEKSRNGKVVKPIQTTTPETILDKKFCNSPVLLSEQLKMGFCNIPYIVPTEGTCKNTSKDK